MKKKRIKIIIILILVLSFPFIGIFSIRQLIEHPDYWKKPVAFFKGARYLGEEGVTFQKHSHDCGPAALKMVFDYFKIPVTLEEISENVLWEKGSSMLSLKKMAELKGLKAEGWRFTFKDLKKIKIPAIVFVGGDHFVVISKITEDGKIIILDPAIGKLKYSSRRFRKMWKGETLILKKRKQSTINSEDKKLKVPNEQ